MYMNKLEVYMVKYLLLLSLILLPLQSFAQKNFMNALYGSQESTNTKNIDPNFSKQKNKSGESKKVSHSCVSDTQTSLPLRVVLGLLRGRGATLEPSFDASSSEMSIYGGPMIGNCNSMLEYYWGDPDGDVPYTFEVRIKKPDGCSTDKCKYNVQTIKNDRVVDLDEQITVEPNMDGFIKCLEKTGVYKNGKINKSNIVTTEFDVDQKGVNKSKDVWFASRGPAAVNSGGGVFSKKNKHKNASCYFYEDIQKDGYKVYTQKDIRHKNLIDEAQTLCKSKDYAEIYGNLKNFKSLSTTYRDLEAIMKEQLLKEVAAAKKEFKKAVKKGDLSKLDTEKYSKLFKDFYELIVKKQLNEDSHDEADENNMNLLVNLYTAYEEAESKDEKAKIEKKIRDLTKKLGKYMEDPYFTLDDYKYFISMKNKAPLKDPEWKSATINLHKALVSLRLSCQAYAVDNKSCSFSNRSNNMKDMATIEEINERVSSYSDKAKSKYEQREYVLKNPANDNSEDFADLIKKCESLYSEANQKQSYYMRTRGQYNQMAMQQCKNKNPYMGMFGGYGGFYNKKFKQCIEDMNYDYKMKYKVSSSKIKLCDQSIDQYKNEFNKWKEIEDLRDKYYYDEDNSDDNVAQNTDGGYHFNFTPGQVQQPNNGFGMNQQYNPQMMNRAMMGMNSGMYNPNMYNMAPSRASFGMNAGYGMGMNSMYGRQPSMMNYGMNNGVYGGMGGMSAPMTNYMGNMSSGGGAYNFTYGM